MTDPTCSLPGCDRKVFARGWCGSHYKRWYRYGDPLAEVNRRAPDGASLETRLCYVGWTERLVRPDLGPCWEWNGLLDRRGYGRVWDGTRVAAAHRASYETWAGPIGPDDLACHRCDNPPCVNPAHLFLGTDADNARDMVQKLRSCNGENRPQHKLTDVQVARLRASYTGARGEQAALARQYGVVPSYVSVLVRGLARTRRTNRKAAVDDSAVAVRVRREAL